MIVGAILTQSVTWSNVEKAIANLKAATALDPVALDSLPIDELARLIRPSRFFNAKAGKIKAFLNHLRAYGYDLDVLFSSDVDSLRQELLSVKGIGPETADSIILYAAFKPVFVIDAYTRRLMSRLGLASDDVDYEGLRRFFEAHLPHDVALFNEYHALIVRHSNRTCLKKPICSGCPLVSTCRFAAG
ncbi:MAG: hypothetical protein HY675_23590 [Chloroflexi bacterium]|nr:hypothetical protein [Chloroflexota bacterium]